MFMCVIYTFTYTYTNEYKINSQQIIFRIYEKNVHTTMNSRKITTNFTKYYTLFKPYLL